MSLKWKLPDNEGLIIMAVDTHPSTPHAVLWAWIDFTGVYHKLIEGKPNIYEVAAIFETGTIPELVKMIQAEESFNKFLGRKHDVMLLDPSAWNKDQTRNNEKSVKEQFEDCGLYPERGSKDLMGGIYKVQELLTVDEEMGHPRLMTLKYNHPGIDYLLYEKRTYHFPDPRKALKLEKNPSQKPVDKDDHMMENERRICEYVYDQDNSGWKDIDDTMFGASGLTNVSGIIFEAEEENEYEENIYTY